MHLSAITRETEFVKHMGGGNLPIIQVMGEISQKQVMKNKAAIKSISQTICFLAKQGLPLRGHKTFEREYELWKFSRVTWVQM